MSSPTLVSAMFRHPSQRYQKAKGLKVKHVLQIAMITVVLTWVMYQLNRSQNPAHTNLKGKVATISLKDIRKDISLGRKVLKPETEIGSFETEVDSDDLDSGNSLNEEKVGAARGVDDFDDQRDEDKGDLDIERSGDQDDKIEDEIQQNDDMDIQQDVGTDFAELKNEQERGEREEFAEDGKDGDADQDDESQSKSATIDVHADNVAGSERHNHLASVLEGDKTTDQKKGATFMEAFSNDSVLRPKLDEMLKKESEDNTDADPEKVLESTLETSKELGEDSQQEVPEEETIDQESEEKLEEADNQSQEIAEVHGESLQESLDSQSQEQPKNILENIHDNLDEKPITHWQEEEQDHEQMKMFKGNVEQELEQGERKQEKTDEKAEEKSHEQSLEQEQGGLKEDTAEEKLDEKSQEQEQGEPKERAEEKGDEKSQEQEHGEPKGERAEDILDEQSQEQEQGEPEEEQKEEKHYEQSQEKNQEEPIEEKLEENLDKQANEQEQKVTNELKSEKSEEMVDLLSQEQEQGVGGEKSEVKLEKLDVDFQEQEQGERKEEKLEGKSISQEQEDAKEADTKSELDSAGIQEQSEKAVAGVSKETVEVESEEGKVQQEWKEGKAAMEPEKRGDEEHEGSTKQGVDNGKGSSGEMGEGETKNSLQEGSSDVVSANVGENTLNDFTMDRIAIEKSIQNFQGTLLTEGSEVQKDANPGEMRSGDVGNSESQHSGKVEEKEGVTTRFDNNEETKSVSNSKDDKVSIVDDEKNVLNDRSSEVQSTKTESSTDETAMQGSEEHKVETLRQATDTTGINKSDLKAREWSAGEQNQSNKEATKT